MPFRDLVFPNFIKCSDKPRKNFEEPVSFMEVTAVLNAYQKIHNPSLSCLAPHRYVISALPLLSIFLVSFLCVFPMTIAFYSRLFFNVA